MLKMSIFTVVLVISLFTVATLGRRRPSYDAGWTDDIDYTYNRRMGSTDDIDYTLGFDPQEPEEGSGYYMRKGRDFGLKLAKIAQTDQQKANSLVRKIQDMLLATNRRG